VCKSEDGVYVAVITFENDVLLKLSDEGKLVWAKGLKSEDEDFHPDLTAVTYGEGYIFAGGNFLAKIDPNDGEVLWCKYPFSFGLIKNIWVPGDYVYVLDDDRIFKLDSQGNFTCVKEIEKDHHYIRLKSMHVSSDGIYVLGWVEDSAAIFMLDHDGNLRWAKRIAQRDLVLIPENIRVDGNIYIVGGLPKCKKLSRYLRSYEQ